jgi:menaquinone-dependent protoporphyrinogen oxidase
MSERRILLVYGTSYGQTAKIAARIASVLRDEGCDVTAVKGDDPTLPRTLAPYDAVVVGGSIITGHHQRYLERFVHAARAELLRLPTGFFSVSGSAGSPLATVRADADRCVARFLARTAWRPDMIATFGGAIAYTRYNPLLRWFIKRLNRKSGGPTDTSCDHELTDWSAVEEFARDVATLVPIAPAPSEAAEPAGSA